MAGRVIDIRTETEFDEAVASNDVAVAFFKAVWSQPCVQMDEVVTLLANDHSGAFLRVEAEDVSDVSYKYEVSAVPYFLFFKAAKLVSRLEGIEVATLTSTVKQLCPPKQKAGAASTISQKAPQSTTPAAPEPKGSALDRVEALVHSQPVMLLMKGTPEAPRCGLSSRTAAILQRLGVPFGSFDILTDESIRQAAKEYSDWPSFPQLYVRGDLIGGCDIVEEMDASGELGQILLAAPNGDAATEPLEDRLKRLTHSADVMLFMKGSPDAPRCGFSSKVVQALNSIGVPFSSFDILEDQEVREGLKKFSDWPTYPQLYAGGELLGGCDIVLELAKQQQLKTEIDNQLVSKQSVGR